MTKRETLSGFSSKDSCPVKRFPCHLVNPFRGRGKRLFVIGTRLALKKTVSDGNCLQRFGDIIRHSEKIRSDNRSKFLLV